MTNVPWVCGAVLRVALATLLFSACALASTQPLPAWQHTLGEGNPLVGRVWDVERATWVDAGALADRLMATRYVLLGEKHDNADHHRLQAWLIESLASSRRVPAVAFEMLAVDQQSTIDRQIAKAPTDLLGFRAAVRWDTSGWPTWELYEPVFGAALAKGLPVRAANLSRDTTRQLVATGSATVIPDLMHDFGLDHPLSPELHGGLVDELEASHCGRLSAGTAERMILVQRARDAEMARQLIRASAESSAVLIAGAFHVRKDYGVPTYLTEKGVSGGVVSVAFTEVRDGMTDPGQYATAFGAESLPFDYVWFTPRVDDDDPCEKFARQLKQMQKKP